MLEQIFNFGHLQYDELKNQTMPEPRFDFNAYFPKTLQQHETKKGQIKIGNILNVKMCSMPPILVLDYALHKHKNTTSDKNSVERSLETFKKILSVMCVHKLKLSLIQHFKLLYVKKYEIKWEFLK